MEQLLRSKEISAINIYNLENKIQYVPIRHHSPVCAWHLKKIIEDWKPDCILIEGPQNAQEQIQVLAHKDTKAPVALYYYYRDKKCFLNEKKDDYRCYYPFLDYSPELVALREAEHRNIPAYFIDLPYSEILLGTKEAKGIRAEHEKQVYNDDYLLSQSQYIKLLCEKTGMKDFEEVWEKYFEIGGLFQTTEQFINQMYLYCTLLREHTKVEELEEDGCLLREQYMAGQIASMSKQYSRMLVVTGGFHTSGLMALLEEAKEERKEIKLHKIAKEDEGVYPLAYSMEATDALNGYASGMKSPGFYQQVWKRLCTLEQPTGVYEDAVLHQLTSTGRKARKKEQNISSYDIICALSMAKGLAALRGKREPGLYELLDSALSSFVKGEVNLSTDMPLRILDELNTGNSVGKLCENALRPPILEDFEQQCRNFGLQIQLSTTKEVTLQLFTKKKHLLMSRFFYQMEFLETRFAKRKKGADLVRKRDMNRIREEWSYQFSSHTLSALIDISMSGGTIEEAAHSRLLKQFAESSNTKETARLLAQGFLMGFWNEQSSMEDCICERVTKDGDFFSLVEGFSHLKMLYELRELYQVEQMSKLEEIIRICFQKILQILPSIANIQKEQQKVCMEACLSLYQITARNRFAEYRSLLIEAFLRLLEKKNIQPELEGTVLGLLYGYDSGYEEQIQKTTKGYLQGTEDAQMKSAAFLRGLFYTARDLIFVQENFLKMIDELLGRLSVETFLQLLPEFRMAFGYFTPFEIDKVAKKAADIHGKEKQQLLKGYDVTPQEYAYGEALDYYVLSRLNE